MNVYEVREAVAEVARWQDSDRPDMAVWRQEVLYRDVVNAIADGNVQGDPAELCREAIVSAKALKG